MDTDGAEIFSMQCNELEPEPPKDGKKDKKGSKEIRKLERKERKTMNILSKQMGIEITNKPTEWLAMWGPSLSMGVSKFRIKSMFPTKPAEVRLYENQMYCTIHFRDVADAISAKETVTGLQFTDLQNIYLGYLAREPPVETIAPVRQFFTEQPEGLLMVENFVTPEEENLILQELFPSEKEGQSLKRRWVKHYGFDFNYDTNNVDPDRPSAIGIPDCLKSVMDRMLKNKFIPRLPQQITLNYYLPGQGIPPHVDTHSAFEGPIISLSLKASVVMDFRNGLEYYARILPQRSLLVMDGSSRYQWTHGIANRTFDIIPHQSGGIDVLERSPRLSLTFRLLHKTRSCDCKYPYMCDSQKGKISQDNAAGLENTLVHQVYEEIASHFSSTRHTAWPEIKKFVQAVSPEDVLLDVGCGNGKYLHERNTFLDVGTDISTGLLNICRSSKQAEVLQSNCLQLPFKASTFNAVICIAVIHHLATEERRLAALQEINRVLVTGGHGLVYVWAKKQSKEDVTSVYAKIQSTKDFGKNVNGAARESCMPSHQYSFLPIHNRESNFPENDMLVPWISGPEGKTVHHRYYHVFDEGELEKLIERVNPPPKIIRSYYDQGNYCIHFIKR